LTSRASFAFSEYLTALAKGNRATAAERKAVAAKLSEVHRLSQDFVERANLRIDPGGSARNLLRDKRSSSVASTAASRRSSATPPARDDEFDLSNSALQGPYTAMFQDYVKNELKWESISTTPRRATCGRGTGTNSRTATWT
jgi:carboxypeptidase C (cathepsin A)